MHIIRYIDDMKNINEVCVEAKSLFHVFMALHKSTKVVALYIVGINDTKEQLGFSTECLPKTRYHNFTEEDYYE